MIAGGAVGLGDGAELKRMTTGRRRNTGGLRLFQKRQNILLGNTAAHAGARDLREIHVVLTRDLANQGRGAGMIVSFFAFSAAGC